MEKLYELLDVDFKYSNDDGSLVQLIHKGYCQINVLISREGSVRGGHYHKNTKEAFYVIFGSVEVVLKRGNQSSTTTFKEGAFFLIPTFTLHYMKFPEDCTMIAMYDIPVEMSSGIKDIWREEHV